MDAGQVKAPEIEESHRYSDWHLLAESRLGETWRAQNAVSGQKCVLKIRRDDVANPGAAARRWEQAATLVSPHLQRLLHFNAQADGRFVIVHEYVPGPSLRERISQGPIPVAQALRHTRDIFSGLMVLHQKGMVHRDVSPENIILSAYGAVLIDFDAVGMLTEDSGIGKTTLAGDFAGKLRYMSPEQIVAAPQSASVDIWAVGTVLYEALTGAPLQSAQSVMDLSRSLGEPPNLAAAPQSVRPFLASLLAPDPLGRPDAQKAIRWIDNLLVSMASDNEPGVVEDVGADAFALPVEQGEGPASDGRPGSDDVAAHRADDPFAEFPPQAEAARPAALPRPRAASKSGGLGVGFAALVILGALGVLVAWALGYIDQSGSNVDSEAPARGPSPILLNPWHLALLCGGILLVGSSFFVARLLRASGARAEVALPYRALELINAPDARDRLAETICLRIDAYREIAGRAAEDMLTVTMVALAKEYAEAESADERFRALQMLNELHAKVSDTLKPWWLQYENLIARALSVTTLVAGIVAAIEGVRGLF